MSTLQQAEALLASRQIDQALAAYDLVAADCDEPDRLCGGRWMCHMLAGDYAEAWRQSDAIRQRGAPDEHRFWLGEPIDGKRVMVRCLRGYGDTVMYLRWLRLLNERASEVIVQAAPQMLPLLRCMPEARCVVGWTAPGESDRDRWDVQVESAELPYLFRATVPSLPAPVALHFAEDDLHRQRLCIGPQTAPRTRPRVGLVWTGSNYDPARSIRFEQLRRLLATQAAEFWSLQAPADNVEWSLFCTAHGWGERTFYTSVATREDPAAAAALHAGIADMAAFASQMDLVITIDTLAAHLAGSLGLPTWLLLKHEADWRWMLDCDDSPWYPAMTLFRQTTSGDWDDVLQRVCDRLRDWCEEHEA